MYFEYGETEVQHLKSKDKTLGQAIDRIGHIYRPVETDLFSSVVNTIIGQQISTAAHVTVWCRLCDDLGEVTVQAICATEISQIQSCGTTFRKAEYIKDFADKVRRGDIDLEALRELSDADVVAELSALKGIGVWTAEMLMTFCMQRPNIFSYGDLAIHRGLRMLYHHRNVDKKLFEKYRRRYSPYGSVASLYLWAIAGGAIEGMKDYSTKK